LLFFTNLAKNGVVHGVHPEGSNIMVPISSLDIRKVGRPLTNGVVEVSLVLPTERMDALLDLSRRREQSVGQLLRQLIDDALIEDDAPLW
jgi:hypothetical protein